VGAGYPGAGALYANLSNDFSPRVNLSVAYQMLGDFDKGLTNSLEAIRLEPDSWYGYVNAVIATLRWKIRRSQAVINTGLPKTNSAVVMHASLYYVAWFRR